jgi:L-fuculose-phosphate aldolase
MAAQMAGEENPMELITGVNDIRFKIAAARRILYRAGCDSDVGGHVSARAEGEDAFWVTPFGYFDETLPSHVIKVDFDLNVLEGNWVASPAIKFHRDIYRLRPDVNSVIHTHSHYVSVFSSRQEPLGMYNVISVFFYNDHAIMVDDGTIPPVYGPRIVETLNGKHTLIVANHGAIICQDSLEHATIEALYLEKAARYHIECKAIGGKEMAEAEVIRSREAYLRYQNREHMWAANLRRLRKSDPELFEACGLSPQEVDFVAQLR